MIVAGFEAGGARTVVAKIGCGTEGGGGYITIMNCARGYKE